MTLNQLIAQLIRWRDMRPGNGDLKIKVVTSWGIKTPSPTVTAGMSEVFIDAR